MGSGRRRHMLAGGALLLALLAATVGSAAAGCVDTAGIAGDSWTLVPAPLKLPWNPLMTDDEVRRGMQYGSGNGLNRVAQKLLAKQPIKVVVLGGSVSSANAGSYTQRLFSFINSTFPHSGHQFVNQAMSGADSGWYAPCVGEYVGQGADLVLVEFTVNDKPAAEITSRERRTYEQLLRRLLRLPRQPAVMLVHHYAWMTAVGDGKMQGLFYGGAEMVYSEMARYYDLPSLSLRGAAWRQMQAGLTGFRVDKVARPKGVQSMAGFRAAAKPAEWRYYVYRDMVNPGATGHQLLAELACSALIRALWEAESTLVLTRRADPRVTALPPPMIPNEFDANSFCKVQGSLRFAAAASTGFEFREARPQSSAPVGKFIGWTGSKTGASLTLRLDTTSGISGDSAPAAVALLYQRGPGHGTAAVTCGGGCTCAQAVIRSDAASGGRGLLQLTATQAPRCLVKITITSTGLKKLHIMGTWVNH